MGALVGVLSKHNDDTVPLVVTMLQELVRRGNQGYEMTTPTVAFSAQSTTERADVMPCLQVKAQMNCLADITGT